ncbi:hypothetical protein MMC29_003877 [Sticta canariensis]|nr:hypothetical protein [Sticta canariensis]
MVGHEVLLASGEEHKASTPFFARDLVKSLEAAKTAPPGILTTSLSEIVTSEPTANDEKKPTNAVVTMSDWLRRVPLDIIGTAAMGYDFNALKEPENELNTIYDTVFNKSHNEGLTLLIETMENLILAIQKLAPALIAEKRKSAEKDDSPAHKNILDVAVVSGQFTDDGLVDQVMTFLATGHETVSSVMSWALVSLCQHPHIQERPRKEIWNGLSSPNDGVCPKPKAIDGFPYLHAVGNEVCQGNVNPGGP